MKKVLVALLMIFTTTVVFSQNRYVILDKNHTIAHIKLRGTTTVSGESAVVYKLAESCELRQAGSNPYQFHSEICCWYDFSDYSKGRGKILNVSDKTAKVRVTCLDGFGLANNTIIVEVKPRTIDHIMFSSDGYGYSECKKIKCELIKLY